MKILRALLIGCAVAMMPSAALAQADAGHRPISSDGVAVPEVVAFSPTSNSFAGTGRELAAGEVDDALANRRGTPESAAEVWELWNKAPVSARIGIESIIGTDTRTRVNPTTTFPARATVLITFSAGRCTGWLIDANTVVTAGHCVHTGSTSTGFYARSSYLIYPGRNGASSPYGSCTARRLWTVNGYANGADDQYDYGAIQLNCNIGNTVGWYGYFWTSASLLNLPTIINGYPGDKPLTQWRATDRVRVNQARRVFYQNDTTGGMSGSPVFYNRSTTCSVCAMAVHAYGLYGSPPFSTNNHGTRIVQAVFNNFNAWKAAP